MCSRLVCRSLIGVLAAPGCGEPARGPADEPESSDAVVAAAYAPCPAEARVGEFAVILEADYSAVEGRVATGVVPGQVREVSASEGECRLLVGRDLFCEPACTPGETCDVDGACVAYPTTESVGEVLVSGLSVPLTMKPTSIGAYTNGATSIPHPGFDEGDVIALSAPGDALPGFALEGRGVARMSVIGEAVELARGDGLAVAWAPGGEASARVRMVLDLAHHGGIAASLECDDIADVGRFDIPAALVSALLDIGVAGFPTLAVARRTADSEVIANGCVELSVISEVVLPVVVPGVTSCASDEDCPETQTCHFDLTCR